MGKEKYILMFKDAEVLSFEVEFDQKNKVSVLEKLDHFDKAPYGMKEDSSIEQLNAKLFGFFNARAIAQPRSDYEEILKATKSCDSFELSFKGHGLSLSNHYWYKKEGENLRYGDINFFTNKWDDSFAGAVLKGDYEALETADLNVPDIVTPGWAVKGWLCEEDGPVLYKLGIDKTAPEEVLGEVLASDLARRLLGENEAVNHELRTVNGSYASCSKCMIGIDEELIPLSFVLPPELHLNSPLSNYSRDKFDAFLDQLIEYGYHDIYQLFIKIMCLKSLCFAKDFHFDNISVIRNLSTDTISIAPLYDLGGAYGGSKTGRNLLSKINKGLLFIVYYIFGGLEPDWDYSWYNPDRLIGFEKDMREILSKSSFFNDELIDGMIGFYSHQKETLDVLAAKGR